MNIKGRLLTVVLGLFAASTGFGQAPPPNDSFSNRIVLSGTDLTFSGSLAGATLEDPAEGVAYNAVGPFTPATQSAWWSWTAPTTTVLNLQILSSAPTGLQNDYKDAFAIYVATNGSTSPNGLELPPLGLRVISFRFAPQTLSVPVTAGMEYQIQLIGSSSATLTSRLIATNAPLLVEQPRNRTVYSNASALFHVIAAGVSQSTFTFQWRLNGTNLANETAAVLALTNVDANASGAYSVIVSNSANYTISEPALLTVSQSNAPISLGAIGTFSNSFKFSLIGENGRSYRIESSADIAQWFPVMEFPKDLFPANFTSVVFSTNSPLVLTVTNDSTRKFFRASPFVPHPSDVDLCANHLQQIRLAKLLWQRDADFVVGPTLTPRREDLLPYFPRHEAPVCPLAFTKSYDNYTVNAMYQDPTCVIYAITHFLEEPR